NSCECYGVSDQQNANNWQQLAAGTNLSTAFHTYAALWTLSSVSWYLDGQLMMSTPTYDSTDQMMHLLFYNWDTPWESGNTTSSSTPDELHTEVDWVRVWQL